MNFLIEKIKSESLFDTEKIIHIIDINESQGKIIEKILRDNSTHCVLIEAGNLSTKSTIRRSFEYAKEDFYAIAFYSPIDKKSWIREQALKHKLSMTEEAMELLTQYSSPNTALNQQNLAKLSLAFGGEQISSGLVLKMLHDQSVTTLWNVCEACILGKQINIDQAMDSYMPLGLLRSITRHIQTILEEKRTGKTVSNTLFLHKKSMEKQKLTEESILIKALSISISAEALCKRGKQDQKEICKSAFAEILSLTSIS